MSDKKEKKVLPIIDSGEIEVLKDLIDPDNNPNRTVTITVGRKDFEVFLDTPRYSDKIILKKAFRELVRKAKEDGTLESTKVHVGIYPLRDEDINKRKSDYIFYPIIHNSADLTNLKLFWKEDPEDEEEEEKEVEWSKFNVVETQIMKGVYVDREYLEYDVYADYEHYEDDLYRESYMTAKTLAMIFAQTKWGNDHNKRFFKSVGDVDRLDDSEIGYLIGCYTRLMMDEDELKNSSGPQKSEEDTPMPNDIKSDSSAEKSGDLQITNS